MSFKDGANIYFDLDPFEGISEISDSIQWKKHANRLTNTMLIDGDANRLANTIRIDDDDWVEEMCDQDVDQFLSSIHKRNSNINRADTRLREDPKTIGRDDNRDDCNSRFPPPGGKNNITNGHNQRNQNFNSRRPIVVEKHERVQSSNQFSFPTRVNHHYVSSTESSESRNSVPRNKLFVSSTENSQVAAPAPRTRSISSGSSWSSVSFPSPESSATKHETKQRRKPLPQATKVILDDLVEMKEKIDSTLAEETIAKRQEMNGRKKFHPERALWILLWERQWDSARRHLQLHPKEAQLKIKLPTVSTTVANNDDLQRIEDHSALPLHLACAIRPLPPTALLQDLINAYPEACRHIHESSGLLPIHMAANLRPAMRFRKECEGKIREKPPTQTIFTATSSLAKGNAEVNQYTVDSTNHGNVINLLLTSYPESISAREQANGMTPLHIAASTTRSENGIVSPVASNVLNILMVNSPSGAVNMCKDKSGMTPRDWAWQNVEYFCPHCGMEKTSATKNKDVALLKSDARCKCPQLLSVSEMCLHPFLRKEIRSHLLGSQKHAIRAETKKNANLSTKTGKVKSADRTSKKSSQPIQHKDGMTKKQPVSGRQQKGTDRNVILSQRELDNMREGANNNIAFRRQTCKKDGLGAKTASLHMKIRLSELVHPSNHGRKRRSSSLVPSPFFEVFAAHRCGMSRSYYKSYPLHGSTEGTWEEAFLDLGLTHKQLRTGTNGAGYIEVGIRVMHLSEKGTDIKLIGTCQVSLETLERQQRERTKLQHEVRNLKNIIGDGRDIDMALPEPEKHFILNGFEVTGKLQVLSLAIK